MEDNGNADAILDGKPATVAQSEPVRNSRTLKNWKHEKFAALVADGTDPDDAYVIAGFARHRANHRRLLRRAPVKARIEVLRRERELAARAARVPRDQVLEELDRRGLARVEDFFERNAAGMLGVCNLETVPVEVSIAFLRALGEGFGFREK